MKPRIERRIFTINFDPRSFPGLGFFKLKGIGGLACIFLLECLLTSSDLCQSCLKTATLLAETCRRRLLRVGSSAGRGWRSPRRGGGSEGSAARTHVTSFPRSLSCRPPSNRCVRLTTPAHPGWPSGTRVARQHPRSLCSLAGATVALVRCLSARGRHCRKPLPLAAGFVAGWPRLSLPGRFPEAGALLAVGGRGAGLGPDSPSPPSSRLL